VVVAADSFGLDLGLDAEQRVGRRQLGDQDVWRFADRLAHVANIWIGIPFNLVILYSGLQSIPGDLYEAAALDGASGWQRFWRVTFPLLRPVSAITLLLGLIYTLKVFDIIWIMTKGGPAGASTTFATWSYQLGFATLIPRFGPSAAVGNMLILMALVAGLVYIRVQRRLEI
jgi:multiple sugar transport system permease protein